MEHAIDTLPKQIELGNQGESGILDIDLDCTTWLTDFPAGEILATFLPPDSYTPELLPITQAYVLEDDVTFRVIVMRNMTRYAGKGSLNIRLVVGDDIEKRSAVVGTYTAPSHSTAAEEAPEDVSDWVNEAVLKLAEVEQALVDSGSATSAANEAAGLASEQAGLANEAAQAAEDAEIVAVEFSGDDIVFTKTSEETVVLTGGKSDLLLNFKGEWDDEAEDAFFDVVEYYGSSYVYTNPIPSTGNVPTNVAYWQLLAKAGGQFVDTESLTWEGVQDVIIQGLGPTVFPIGTQLQTAHSAYVTIVWIVAAHNYDLDPTGRKTYSMTLLMHHVIYGRQFDNTEALYYCAAELPAGTYKFALPAGYDEAYGGGLTYQFTLSNVVPAGGVIMFPWGYNVQASTIQISSYPTQISTSAIESVSVTVGNGGTALGTADGLTANMNHAQRIRYGSNNWNQSAVRQWLNSAAEANAWWTPQTIFDRPPTYADVAGFLNGLDPAFVAVLGETDRVTVNNTVTDGGGAAETRSYVTRDKIYLPSRTEIYGTHENALAPEGAQYPYYADTVDADKIKYDLDAPTTARYWWMRSPSATSAYIARLVYGTTGALYYSNANIGTGAAAACVIL